MKVRAIDLDKEYDRFVLWWAKRNLSAPPKIILRGATGFVVHTGQVDVVAGWLYISGNVGFAEWIIANPAIAATHAAANALSVIFSFMSEFAKTQGVNVLMCGTQDKGSLGRFLTDRDWHACEGQPHQFLIKAL